MVDQPAYPHFAVTVMPWPVVAGEAIVVAAADYLPLGKHHRGQRVSLSTVLSHHVLEMISPQHLEMAPQEQQRRVCRRGLPPGAQPRRQGPARPFCGSRTTVSELSGEGESFCNKSGKEGSRCGA